MELSPPVTELASDVQSYSNHVYRPHRGRLVSDLAFSSELAPLPSCPYHEARGLELCGVRTALVREVPDLLKRLITKRFYPCVAALQAFHREEYRVGLYKGFGLGRAGAGLRRDLLAFMAELKRTGSQFLTFMAIFDDSYEGDEIQFEKDLWRELSSLTSGALKSFDWPTGANADPAADDFCFHLGGEAFFVVGLHSNSSRLARRLPYPTLIFNVFRQFEQLEASGQYGPMVKVNRERDLVFQGSVNPMVELYGDVRESIQFSGRENSPDWKCPFQFLKSEES